MPVILAFDTLDNPTRVGGTCATLNTPGHRGEAWAKWGSAVAWPWFLERTTWTDMCIFNDELWCVYRDATVLTVKRFTAGAWTQMGRDLDPLRPTFGPDWDQWIYLKPQIATDGVTVWLSMMAYSVNRVNDPKLISWELRQAYFDGSDWVYGAGGDGFAGTLAISLSSNNDFFSPYAATAVDSDGICWMAYTREDDAAVRIFGSDGTTAASALNTNPPGTVGAVTRRDGAVVIAYISDADELVLAEAATGATITATARVDLFPEGSDPGGGDPAVILDQVGHLKLYGTDKLVVTTAYGPMIINEDGSDGWYAMGGGGIALDEGPGFLGGASLMPIAADTLDPQTLWTFTNGKAFKDLASDGAAIPWSWQPACTAEKVSPNPYNPPPARKWRGTTDDLSGIIPFSGDGSCVNNNPVTDGYLGVNSLIINGDHLYIATLYVDESGGGFTHNPSTDPGTEQKDWAQFIVYDIPICRGCGSCPTPTAYVFRHSHKAGLSVETGDAPAAGEAGGMTFNPVHGFKI